MQHDVKLDTCPFHGPLLFNKNYTREQILRTNHKHGAEILGDTYRIQVLLPRITNNQVQDSTWDSAQPYVQTLGTYVQTKLGQGKSEQPFIQCHRRTYVINSYPNIRT